jgi:hypothetical protein
MVKEIPLSKGLVALVDDEDYERIAVYKWSAHWLPTARTFVAQRHESGSSRVPMMHREILNAPPGIDVDHKDHNGLNNQRSNIRLCSNTQNQANKRKSLGKSSRFKGVSWNNKHRQWYAYIKDGDRLMHLGHFIDEIEAATVYDAKAREVFGEFALTNFAEEVGFG